MVPPPATGDEFPDFENMTPEEQMAWLESLAKRQGVDDNELTTAADVEINEISPDTVVDEPGYTPFEGSVSARRMKEAAEAAAQAAAKAEPEPDSEAAPAMADMGDVADAADPMQWLDDLSAQSGEDFGELEDVFADVGGWEDSAPSDLSDMPEEPESVAAESAASAPEFPSDEAQSLEPVAEGALPEPDEDDPLGGMDPMLFLESLAKKQGVDQSELTTSADLEIEEVSPDTVVDEPGYTPFEGSVSARRMKEAAEAADQAAAEAEAEPAQEPDVEPVDAAAPWVDELPAEASAEGAGEPLEGADEMTWLESLAKRQGAETEELLTSADVDVPELPEDTVIDEPGYVEYSPFGILSSEQEIEQTEVPESAAEEGFEDSALSWLEDLAAEPDDEFSELFAEVDELGMDLESEEDAGEAIPAEPAAVPPPEQVSDDPLAGMTDEDIARAQAHGELTPHQELAWLKRQAAGLAAAREPAPQAGEEDEFEEVELEPAQPGEMPPWLLQMRDEAEEVEEVGEPGAAALFAGDEAAADTLEPAELPGLFEEDEAAADLDISELALDTDELSLADVDELWAEEPVEGEDELPEVSPDSELAAFIKGDLVPEADPLAEALDAEYERMMLGDDTEPEWYVKAKEQVEAGALAIPEGEAVDQPPQAEETPSEPVVAPAEPVDMPDWLREKADQVPVDQAEDMPDWLASSGQEAPASAGDMPDWLAEKTPATEPEDMTGWLDEVDAEEIEEDITPWEPASVEETLVPEPVQAEAESVQTPAPEEPAPRPSAEVVQPEVTPPAPPAVPEGELFAQYRQRLETDPHDHASRLALARALLSQDQMVPSLDHYEALIQSSHLLQDVANDLVDLVNAQPDVPRIRRLLGDTYMRQGRLQEALDAYRSALDKL